VHRLRNADVAQDKVCSAAVIHTDLRGSALNAAVAAGLFARPSIHWNAAEMVSELVYQSNRRPLELPWNYDRTELLADGVVHAIGFGSALVAVAFLLDLTFESTQGLKTASVLIYVAGLLAMLGLSAAYNMWPVSPRKWLLRRFDHSAIYLLIAATYTAFIAQMKVEMTLGLLLLGIWSVAIVGIVVKLAFPGRLDRVSIGFYLLLGWGGMVAYNGFATLPKSALVLIAVGGLLYSVGVVFHLWERLRFQNAIWHGFVVIGASCHYAAILDCVALAPA
jgi:hemolysin III